MEGECTSVDGCGRKQIIVVAGDSGLQHSTVDQQVFARVHHAFEAKFSRIGPGDVEPCSRSCMHEKRKKASDYSIHPSLSHARMCIATYP